jgi:uroporphyrinogen decarboxylase
MNHRERVLAALNHRSPDRIPVDVGGALFSGINLNAYEALKAYLGFTGGSTEPLVRRSHIARLDEHVLATLDVDCRGLIPAGPEVSVERELPDGSYVDMWGVTWAKPDRGHYYIKKPVFTSAVTSDELRRYRWPDATDPGFVRGLSGVARALHDDTDYAVILTLPVGFVHQSQFMRGYEDWLMDLVTDPSGVASLCDAILDVWLEVARRMIDACSPFVDVVAFGDDVAFQNGPMMSPDVFRSLIKPRMKRVFDLIKNRCEAKILFHTCGSAVSLIPDLLELGMDALNPVQVSAKGMDTGELKRLYGKDLTFWGAVDTQRVLPFGAPDDVRAEVAQRIDDLADGGGYVLGAVHIIQAEVPPENILAMVEAAHQQ